MYKYLVFFDLDSTLFDKNSQVTDEVAEAMDQIRENGGLPVIATGRTLYEIPETLKKTKIDTAVTSNGDHGIYKGKELFERRIDPHTIDELDDFAKQHGNSITVLDQEGKGASRHDELLKKACAFVHAPLPKLVDRQYWYDRPIDMMFVTTTDLDDVYEEKFGDRLSFYRNSPFSIDVVDYGASKASGIKQLMEMTGLTGIPTYAFGDGNNDIPMLDFVDHPVVMENGRERVKDHAEFVTTANTNHGIVNGLRHFDLI
ncbi:Cof-type HAD-IIB family hydrolase [Fructilactobacillus cliffordii]|uniref:Cof-type HAD-IIB family hydrolase n=1 Tax=Fructilactobacillus cliffordii TaxID=2940299 RepID=UPI002091FCFA|nr:Cof-type HAD-IIB family hydrolase [Fructilactobacillus cliffordii]USS86884.1 Cof-type HAD-IIB family hydrolase [Fructilactobacillus cliffordii]